MATKAKVKADKILTAAQAAKFLQVDVDILIGETSAGRVPARSLAGEYRYSRLAILRWIRAGTVQPAVPLEYADPDDPWTPEKERLVEAEIEAIYAARRSLGTVGDLQAKSSG